MEHRAQTNIQLFNQLRHSGYTDDETLQIKTVYGLAVRLFASGFRASGKPFLAHLVGTASILTALRARAVVVAGGLLHAAYSLGEFGAGWRGVSEGKRAYVRRAVGTEVEDLVCRYTRLQWDIESISTIHNRVSKLTHVERDVLLIRLANELDDHLDLEILYCGNADDRRKAGETRRRLYVELAEALGFPKLSAAIDRALDAACSSDLPPCLRTNCRASFVVRPRSRIWWRVVRLRQILAGHHLGYSLRGQPAIEPPATAFPNDGP
jgi:(p)ppGpp synthase/HD superfamily hydrolase